MAVKVMLVTFTYAIGFLWSCKTTNYLDHSTLKEDLVVCTSGVNVSELLRPEYQCLKDKIWPEVLEEKRRLLAPMIPCNSVEWIDQTNDLFGDPVRNDEAAIRSSTFFKVFNEWLGKGDRFQAAEQGDFFSNLQGRYPANQNNPILDGAIAKKIHQMIEAAESFIFLDIFLIGGSWGVEVARDLVRAARRGVHVIIIHDTASVFAVGNEMIPLWDRLLELAQSEPNLTALAANLSTPSRVSSIPFGLERLAPFLTGLVDLTISADGRSDHSKILITDALFREDIGEFNTGSLSPKAMISSRNMVDSAASYYYDEAIVIEGPAAVAALLHYQSDIYWAWQQAKNQKQIPYGPYDERLLTETLAKIEQMAKGPLVVKSRGHAAVEALQVSADDEIRNLDSSILRRIIEARSTIDLYGKIAYNWPLAIALKEAMARGVKVRMIFDQQTSTGALLNASLPYMIGVAPRRLANGRTTREIIDHTGRKIGEEDLQLRWHLPFRPGFKFSSPDRTDLAQEIHAKTIIVDGRYTLFGSTNMDSFTWAGGFREYSVWLDSEEIATRATQVFDRLFDHPLLTVSHKVWLGRSSAPSEALEFFANLRNERSDAECPPAEEVCDPLSVLQGGRDYRPNGPQRELVRRITQWETERIKAVRPDFFSYGSDGQIICRKLAQ